MSNFKSYLNVFIFDTELPGTGERLQIKPITTGIMKRMLLYENAQDEPGKIEEALDELIQNCVVTPGFNVETQYLQDRFFLITELRKVTKGNMYTFQSICPKCNSQSNQTIDLTKLKLTKSRLADEMRAFQPVVQNVPKASKMKPGLHVQKAVKEETPVVVEAELKEETTAPKNPSFVELNEKIGVEMSLITRGMQKESFKIVNPMKGLNESQKAAEVMTLTTAHAIRSIITPDGKETPSLEDKVFLLNNLNQGEMERITKWFENYDFGLEFSFNTTCSHCHEAVKREVPVEDFFS